MFRAEDTRVEVIPDESRLAPSRRTEPNIAIVIGLVSSHLFRTTAGIRTYFCEIANPSMMTGLPVDAMTILTVPLRTLVKFATEMT